MSDSKQTPLAARPPISPLSEEQSQSIRGGRTVQTGTQTMPSGLHNRIVYGDSTAGFNKGIFNSVTKAGGLTGAGADYDTTTLANQGGVLVSKGAAVVFGSYSYP